MAMTRILATVAALMFVACVAALPDPDLYISYGDCYYKINEEADSTYIPVGNSIYGHFSCCQNGDKFNANNVCVHSEPTFTYSYLAGCTDSSYQDGACPYKGDFGDYQWVGLVNCEDQDYDGLVSWAGCSNDGHSTVRKSDESEGCTCILSGQNQDEVLFRAPGSLTAFGVLPMQEGMNGTWFSGWDPDRLLLSAIAAATSATVTTRSAVPVTTRPFSTTPLTSILSTSSISSSTQTQMSTVSSISAAVVVAPLSRGPDIISPGAIAGTVVGVIIGCSLFVGTAFVIRKHKNRKINTISISGYDEKSHESKTPDDSIVKAYSEADSQSPDFTKFELPGSPTNTFETGSHRLGHPNHSAPSSHGASEQVYRPFRYQPSMTLQDIPEMPTRNSRVGAALASPNPFPCPTKEQKLACVRGSLAELPG